VPPTKHLVVVASSVFLTIFLVFGCASLINELVFRAKLPDLEWTLNKTNDARESQERAYQATVSEVVPFFKEWYSNLESQGESLLPLLESNAGAGKESSECLERLAEDIKNTVPVTSPAMVERVLQNMGLVNQRFVRSHLNDLLTEPQTLGSIYDETFSMRSSFSRNDALCLHRRSHKSVESR
jgi:hypothetical protein